MTPRRALQIIFSVWGSEGVLNSLEAKETTEAELPGETALATLCRVAGINLSQVQPFASSSPFIVRGIVARRELELLKDPS